MAVFCARMKSIGESLGVGRFRLRGAAKRQVRLRSAVVDGRGALEAMPAHPDAVRRRKEAEARFARNAEEAKELHAQLSGRSFVANPKNMIDVTTTSELERVLALASREQSTVVASFKARWCTNCARMQYRVKKAAEGHPNVQFVTVDVTDRNGDLYQYCVHNGLRRIPYFWVFKGSERVHEGKWSNVQLPKSD